MNSRKKQKKPLIIAGNIEPEWQAFFNAEVKPLIDGEHIAYIGPVNDQQKQELLSKAIAFLMLIKWEEPFGIVMAEALSCGVPVVALDRGSVPEVVMHGQNGIRGRTLPDLIQNFSLIETIASADCREDAIERFSIEAVSSGLFGYHSVMRKKGTQSILILTSGSPATNPRMVKEANALVNRGYDVHVLYGFIIGWADKLDYGLLEPRRMDRRKSRRTP